VPAWICGCGSAASHSAAPACGSVDAVDAVDTVETIEREVSGDVRRGDLEETGDSRQQTADNRQQTADSRQQTADSRQQTADSRQQTAGSRQQTAHLLPAGRLLLAILVAGTHTARDLRASGGDKDPLGRDANRVHSWKVPEMPHCQTVLQTEQIRSDPSSVLASVAAEYPVRYNPFLKKEGNGKGLFLVYHLVPISFISSTFIYVHPRESSLKLEFSAVIYDR
jgi:hypothetical protein